MPIVKPKDAKPLTGLQAALKDCKVGVKPKEPLWGGPVEVGTTQSLLSKYIVCPERFRIRVIEGLASPPKFNHRLEFGSLWHICEEYFAKDVKHDWRKPLLDACKKLAEQYPLDRGDINKWYNVILKQFPHYVKFWEKHPDIIARKPLIQEQVFCVDYKLPSGRTCKLKGKFDSVDLVAKGKIKGIVLQENKTKSDIVPEQVEKQLRRDLQTMFYLIALQSSQKYWYENGILAPYDAVPITGVRYNVIRRPLSGGRGTIKRNEAKETEEQYYCRLEQYFIDEPEYWFMRWNTEVTAKDVVAFKEQVLDPVLENLLDDYEWWNCCIRDGHNVWNYVYRHVLFPNHAHRHFILPFGVYNVIADGGATDLDEFTFSGSEVGLQRGVPLFTELQ